MVRVFAKMEESPEIARHGQVFTKPHIVSLILNLCGYDRNRPLYKQRLLEPGCGDGAFLAEAVARLLDSCPKGIDHASLKQCLLGVEQDERLVTATRLRLKRILTESGVAPKTAKALSDGWVRHADFLGEDVGDGFDFVVGNPPYVRQEAIDKEKLLGYRQQFRCFFDRADLYMAFIEKGLTLLSQGGTLGFICPNRFARNRYGSKLRAMIAEEFSLTDYIDLAETSPFEPEVLAYPGIFIVQRGKTKAVRFAQMLSASELDALQVEKALREIKPSKSAAVGVHVYDEWFRSEAPWITESPAHLSLIREIEERFPALGSEESGTKVGIGVATGADRVFIVDKNCAEVERQLLVPLATTADVLSGKVEWTGNCVINPFKSEKSSELIDLRQFPKARSYFESHRQQVERRNVAKRNSDRWFRTIDRIYPSLTKRPKLLIPDIKANNHIVYESGKLYPHHNLYYVTSDVWELQTLQTILRSSIAKFFVWVYGVKMRSGFLRFQAQYLRRIRVPGGLDLARLDLSEVEELQGSDDINAIDAAAAKLYRLTKAELRLIQETVAPSDKTP